MLSKSLSESFVPSQSVSVILGSVPMRISISSGRPSQSVSVLESITITVLEIVVAELSEKSLTSYVRVYVHVIEVSTGLRVDISEVISPSSISTAVAQASVYVSSFWINTGLSQRRERIGVFPATTSIVLTT